MTVAIVSFGFRHAPPPNADLTLDTRRLLHDPHIEPALRNLTGADEAVRQRVLATPGAPSWVTYTAATIHVLAADCRRDITVAVGGRPVPFRGSRTGDRGQAARRRRRHSP